jgi:voltage-gated potassium channel
MPDAPKSQPLRQKPMDKLKEIIERQNTLPGKVFDITIQLLIVISIVTFSLETVPELSESTKSILNGIETLSIAVFTVEYLCRILVSEHKLKFIFSFYGLIDLLAILPAYLQVSFDLRSLRVLRLLRLFRILKLVRYNRALRRIHLAFRLVKEELILFMSVAGIVVYLSAVGIYHFEYEAQPEKFCLYQPACGGQS